MEKLTLADLKNELELLGLSTRGSKKYLLERITNYKLEVGDVAETFKSQEEELRPQDSISNVSGR